MQQQIINRLQELVFRLPRAVDEKRTLHKIIQQPLAQRKINSHWIVDDVWNWPRVDGVQWRDLKKESITNKLLALKRRGKGPLCRVKEQEDALGSKKKKKRR